MQRTRLKLARVYAVSDTFIGASPFQSHESNVNEYLRSAFDSAGAVMYTIDRAFRITMVNQEWDRFALERGGLAITSASVIGKNVLESMTGEPRQTVQRVCEAIFSGVLPRYTLEVDCSTDSPLFYHMEISPLKSSHGEIIGASFCSRDVTALKQLEAEVGKQQQQLEKALVTLRQREARANILQRIAEALNSMQSLPALLQAIADAAVNEGIFQATAIYLLDETNQHCDPVGSCGLDVAASDPRAFAFESSLAGRALREQHIQLIEDASHEDQCVVPKLSAGPARSIAALPILADGVKGVLEVYADQAQAFEGEQSGLLSTLADQVALAIRTTRSFARERRRTELMRLLNQVGAHLASELRTQAIVQYVTNVLVDQLGITFARVWLYDNITDELVLRSSSGLYTSTTGAFSRVKIGQYRVGTIAALRQSFVTHDVANEPGLGDRDWAEQTGIRSFAGYPLIARDHLLGVVGFFGRQPLDDELISMMEPFVHQVSLALERAQLYVAQVAARREAQAHARMATEQATQLSATLAAMGDGVWTCGRHGELLTVNRAALTMFGLVEGQTQLRTIEDIPLLFAADCDDSKQCFGLRAALQGRTVRDELTLELERRPQSTQAVAVIATPMRDAAGRVVGAVAVVRDVTQQKALEQLRVDFISAAAHELKTPITTLKGYAQLALMRMRTNIDRPRLQRALESIDIQADRVVHTVQKLMDVTRMQVGLLDLQPEVIDLVALARGCVGQTQAISSRHKLSLVAPEKLEIMADRLRITLVVQNMLDNAIKYSPEGGTIEIELRSENGEALLTVRDHGIGISHDKQSLIFEPWYQAHAQSVGDIGGMGLGLSISREIVERHGGRMWCDSTEGAGSLFGFTLPLLDR